jgi:hypothetical protein
MSETAIQRSILDNLLWRGILAWRQQSIPTPIRRGRLIIGLRKADIHTVGIPDIACIINGQYFGIEVKTENGKQRPEQKDWQEKLQAAGASYILARSWEDVARALDLR